MASEAEFVREAQREFDTPNKRKRKSSVGRDTGEVIKMIARDLKKRDTGGSFITVAYYFDKNKDKTLSQDEFFAMLHSLGFTDVTDTVSNKIFKFIDSNDDGKIDYFEFIKAMNEALLENPSHKKLSFSPGPPKIVKVAKPKSPGLGTGPSGLTVYTQKDDISSSSVLIALEEMDIKYDHRELSITEIASEEFGRRNPRHETPVLVTTGAAIHEVLAILNWLSSTYPAKSAAFPPDPPSLAKALTRLSETQHLFQVAKETQKLISRENWQDLKEERSKVEKAIHEEFKLWNSYVEGDFILSNGVSLVDAAVFPILNWFQAHDSKSLDKYPRLKSFYEKFSKRRSVQQVFKQ